MTAAPPGLPCVRCGGLCGPLRPPAGGVGLLLSLFVLVLQSSPAQLSGLSPRLTLANFEGGDSRKNVAFSPAGDELAFAKQRRLIQITNPDTGVEIQTLTGHYDSVNALQYSADGRLLVSGDAYGLVIVWERSATGLWRRATAWTDIDGDCALLAVSPDGTRVLTSGSATLEQRRLADGALLRQQPLPQALTCLEYAPARPGAPNAFAYGTAGTGSVSVADADTGTVLLQLATQGSSVQTLSYSPAGLVLASGGSDPGPTSHSLLWDVVSGTVLRPLGGDLGQLTSSAFAPDGRRLVAGSADGNAYLWTVNDGHPLPPPLPASRAGFPVTAVAFRAGGTGVAVGDAAGVIRLWDVFSSPSPSLSPSVSPGTWPSPSFSSAHSPPSPLTALSPSARPVQSISSVPSLSLIASTSPKASPVGAVSVSLPTGDPQSPGQIFPASTASSFGTNSGTSPPTSPSAASSGSQQTSLHAGAIASPGTTTTPSPHTSPDASPAASVSRSPNPPATPSASPHISPSASPKLNTTSGPSPGGSPSASPKASPNTSPSSPGPSPKLDASLATSPDTSPGPTSPSISTSPEASPSSSPPTSPKTSPQRSPSPSPSPRDSPSTSLDPSASPSRSASPSPSPIASASLSASPSPSPSPSASPSASTNPKSSPRTSPSSSPKSSANPSPSPKSSPSTSPKTSPSTSPKPSPSASPKTSPSTSPKTSPSPSTSPKTSPSTSPKTNPSTSPKTSPSTSPLTSPQTNPGNPSPGSSTSPKTSPQTSPNPSPSPSPSPWASPPSSPSTSRRPSPSPSLKPSPSPHPKASPSASPQTSPSPHPKASPSTSPQTSPSPSHSFWASPSPSNVPSWALSSPSPSPLDILTSVIVRSTSIFSEDLERTQRFGQGAIGPLNQTAGMPAPQRAAVARATTGVTTYRYLEADHTYLSVARAPNFRLDRPGQRCNVTVVAWGPGVSKVVISTWDAINTSFDALGIQHADVPESAQLMLVVVDRMDEAGALRNDQPLVLDVAAPPGHAINLTGLFFTSGSVETGTSILSQGATIVRNGAGFVVTLPHTSAVNLYDAGMPTPTGGGSDAALYGLFALLALPLLVITAGLAWACPWAPRKANEELPPNPTPRGLGCGPSRPAPTSQPAPPAPPAPLPRAAAPAGPTAGPPGLPAPAAPLVPAAVLAAVVDIREPFPDDIPDPPRDCVCGPAAWQAVSSAPLCDVVVPPVQPPRTKTPVQSSAPESPTLALFPSSSTLSPSLSPIPDPERVDSVVHADLIYASWAGMRSPHYAEAVAPTSSPVAQDMWWKR